MKFQSNISKNVNSAIGDATVKSQLPKVPDFCEIFNSWSKDAVIAVLFLHDYSSVTYQIYCLYEHRYSTKLQFAPPVCNVAVFFFSLVVSCPWSLSSPRLMHRNPMPRLHFHLNLQTLVLRTTQSMCSTNHQRNRSKWRVLHLSGKYVHVLTKSRNYKT